MERRKIHVRPKAGLRIPVDPQEGNGGYYPDMANLVERTPYVIRRLRDGDLIECAAPQPIAAQAAVQPQPLTERAGRRNKSRNSRGEGGGP